MGRVGRVGPTPKPGSPSYAFYAQNALCYDGTIDAVERRQLMDSIQATRLRKGMLIKLDVSLFRVIGLHHLTPGNKRGFVQSRLRNIRTGALSDHKFRSEDDVERATLDEREMQFMYRDGETFHFMDTATFDQAHIGGDVLGDVVSYLLPDAVIRVKLYEEEPVGIELPQTVDLTVEDTAPAIKGATASAQLKPARLETGLVVQVPPFVSNGDKICVNTGTGEYQSRA